MCIRLDDHDSRVWRVATAFRAVGTTNLVRRRWWFSYPISQSLLQTLDPHTHIFLIYISSWGDFDLPRPLFFVLRLDLTSSEGVMGHRGSLAAGERGEET